MFCKICAIKDKNLRNEIEECLYASNGTVTLSNIKKWKKKYPAEAQLLSSISDEDFEMHWNFHQAESKNEPEKVLDKEGEVVEAQSLVKDINKSEGKSLGDLLSMQFATFTCLTKKINKAYNDADTEDLRTIVINDTTLDLYKSTAASIRETSKEIRALNADINGSKSDSLAGLKSLVTAISGSSTDTGEDTDLTTDMYDEKED